MAGQLLEFEKMLNKMMNDLSSVFDEKLVTLEGQISELHKKIDTCSLLHEDDSSQCQICGYETKDLWKGELWTWRTSKGVCEYCRNNILKTLENLCSSMWRERR
jgi:hypothetical protein